MKYILATLAFSFLLAACAGSVRENASEGYQIQSPAVIHQKTCFVGSFSSYENWVSALEEKYPDFSRKKFSKKASKEEFDSFQKTSVCKFIQYRVGNVNVEGYFIAPKDFENKSNPVVIFNRGGNGKFGIIKHMTLLKRIKPFVDQGYIVLASNYRQEGTAGSELDDEFGGRDVDDVLALFDIIDDIPQADGDRVGMFGWSRGGMMAYLSAKKTKRIKAIVTGASPTDLWESHSKGYRLDMERVYQKRIPNYEWNREELLKARSVVHWVDKLKGKPPILIMHGTADKRAHPMHAFHLADQLQQYNHPYKLIMFEGGDHGIRQHRKEVMEETLSWFEKYL